MKSDEPCVRCGSQVNIQKHHIVYSSPTVPVCFNCHKQVTLLNTVVARIFGGKLDDNMRLRIWEIFNDITQEYWFQNSILRFFIPKKPYSSSQEERLE